MGLGGQNGTDGLFSLRALSTLSLWQVRPEVSDNILANLGFLSGNLISCLLQKGEKEASSFHTNPPELVQPTDGHLHTGECAAMLVDLESL
jgi:hypothetical protein